MLHYLEDWGPALAELRRVLKPRGRLIASVDHPFAVFGLQRQAGLKADYFATYNWTEDWTMGGQTVPMSFWNRPLHAMTDAFTTAGFRISVISEPDPVPEARELFPDMPRRSRASCASCSSSCTPANCRVLYSPRLRWDSGWVRCRSCARPVWSTGTSRREAGLPST